MRLLVVEDDPALGEFLVRVLQEAAWAADLAVTGAAALTLLAVNEYDLVILDIGLPGEDGFSVCRTFRTRGGTTPILILTARDALSDRVTGLDAGADDYLAKPFAVEELLARLRALARRPKPALDVQLRFADLELVPAERVARRGDRVLSLTHREYALLEHLLRHPRRVQSRSRILEHVWDDNFDPVGNVVEVLIARLRRKVDAPGFAPLIHTVRGAGYVLTDTPAADVS
ncbi:MAG TPA: response regulator transcription factor [Gemmatimonadales bacterium]|nr:response regulator transcription factor [Gemmatimonadales bacterium]